jgi:hypothetical protein
VIALAALVPLDRSPDSLLRWLVERPLPRRGTDVATGNGDGRPTP